MHKLGSALVIVIGIGLLSLVLGAATTLQKLGIALVAVIGAGLLSLVLGAATTLQKLGIALVAVIGIGLLSLVLGAATTDYLIDNGLNDLDGQERTEHKLGTASSAFKGPVLNQSS